ncbi:MAG TPA: hypothetical protein VGL78_03680 [Solirubrobacteraceae bacterium]
MQLGGKVLDESWGDLSEAIAAKSGQQVGRPHLRVAAAGTRLEIRHRVLRPPLAAHEIGQGRPGDEHNGSQRAECLSALDLPLKRLRVALARELAGALLAALPPPDPPTIPSPLDAHPATFRSISIRSR